MTQFFTDTDTDMDMESLLIDGNQLEPILECSAYVESSWRRSWVYQ
jgi:hypothetical protein